MEAAFHNAPFRFTHAMLLFHSFAEPIRARSTTLLSSRQGIRHAMTNSYFMLRDIFPSSFSLSFAMRCLTSCIFSRQSVQICGLRARTMPHFSSRVSVRNSGRGLYTRHLEQRCVDIRCHFRRHSIQCFRAVQKSCIGFSSLHRGQRFTPFRLF